MKKWPRIFLGVFAFGLPPLTASAKPTTATPKPVTAPSVVLVHGAFADGSSWNKVIPGLEARGLQVVSVQNPLTSLRDDVAAVDRVLAEQTGPVVLVGHSWGGTVITEAGNSKKVAALVYVAAFAPSEGQSSSELGKGYPTPPGVAHFVSYEDGFIGLSTEGVLGDFAQDLPPAEALLIAATQGPIRSANFDEKVGRPAWKSKPSWYIVATSDHMIDPGQQRAMAKKIRATTSELPTSHVPMASRPDDVVEVIAAAAKKAAAH